MHLKKLTVDQKKTVEVPCWLNCTTETDALVREREPVRKFDTTEDLYSRFHDGDCTDYAVFKF
jgi:hypothetical protein